MSEERDTVSEGWIWIYDRRTGRVASRLKLRREEMREIVERRAAGGDPAVLASEPIPAGYRLGEAAITSVTYGSVDPPPYTFEHDPAAGAFRLTAPNGGVEAFRDQPTKHLCVEPDSDSGEMRPVMKRGRPVYLYLCRRDREARRGRRP